MEAATLAANPGLRDAGAMYVATAAMLNRPLCTLDEECPPGGG